MLKISAPGKLMIVGEHAVVYGQPCIVTAVNERLHVSIEPSETVQFETPHTNDTRFLEAALSVAKKRFGQEQLSVKIKTYNGFFAVKGFGSSSAVTVATIKALAQFLNQPITDREVFDAAYEAVLSVQGVGSGFDVAAATYGGTLLFSKGGEVLEPLSLTAPLPLVVGYTGIKADTAGIVKEIAQKRAENSNKVDRIFQAIGELVMQAKASIQNGDIEQVGKFMDFNQEYLRDLGVSSEKLEALISSAKHAGAYGAKLSGAGRGDCMIAIVAPEKKEAVEDAIRLAGGEVISVGIHADGVKIDTTDDQSELFIVVDKHDNVLGYRTRQECHRDTSLIHRAVGLLIFDDQHRVLLQKRSMTKDTRPGYWSTSVGGHVSKGESYEQAILRETQEELGIHLPVTFEKTFLNEYPYETEMNALFLANSTGPFHPSQEEVSEIRFFDRQELSSLVATHAIQLSESATKDLQAIHFLP